MADCFISEDPAHDGLLWYAYCSNNPMTFTDPTGLVNEGNVNSSNYPDGAAAANAKNAEKAKQTLDQQQREQMLQKQWVQNSDGTWSSPSGRLTGQRSHRDDGGDSAYAGGIPTTQHGMERIPTNNTRAKTSSGTLTLTEAEKVKNNPNSTAYEQNNGATAYVLKNKNGKSDVVIWGEGGYMTSMANQNKVQLSNSAKSFEWTPIFKDLFKD